MSKIQARTFNKNGLKKARQFLDNKEEPNLINWIFDPEYSSKIENRNLEVDTDFQFSNKYELGKYLVENFGDITEEDLYQDSGFWTWICFLYLEQLVERKRNGAPIYRKHWNYMLTPKGHKSSLAYRHRIFAWYYAFLNYGDKSKLFLSDDEPFAQGDTIEQLLSTNWALTQHFDLFYDLYFDEKTGRAKKGSLNQLPTKDSKKTKGKYAGSGKMRRLLKVLQQIDTVYITHKLSKEDIKEIIGDEFKDNFDK